MSDRQPIDFIEWEGVIIHAGQIKLAYREQGDDGRHNVVIEMLDANQPRTFHFDSKEARNSAFAELITKLGVL